MVYRIYWKIITTPDTVKESPEKFSRHTKSILNKEDYYQLIGMKTHLFLGLSSKIQYLTGSQTQSNDKSHKSCSPTTSPKHASRTAKVQRTMGNSEDRLTEVWIQTVEYTHNAVLVRLFIELSFAQTYTQNVNVHVNNMTAIC